MKQQCDRVAGLDVHRDTVVACMRIGRGDEPGDPSGFVYHDDRRGERAGRMDGRLRSDPCGDGVDRRLLEAGVLPARGSLRRAVARERRSREERPGTQDRCRRRRVARRRRCAWHGPAILRASVCRCASCGRSRDTERPRSWSVPRRSSASTRCSKTPGSRSPRSPRRCWASRPGP